MRRILIAVDMQNDFIDGVLGTKEAEAVVERVKEKIRSYPVENMKKKLPYFTSDCEAV